MYIRISQLKDHSISVDQTRHDISFAAKYPENYTIKNSMFHKTTLSHDMIFTKEDSSTSDKKVELISID